jgi:K+-sensing histidine kinase KdpD
MNTSGIGLGLVISKLIVSKFDGIIDFVSKYKEGSTFFYTIVLNPPEDGGSQVPTNQKETSFESVCQLKS